jgi:hypothetical protein
MSTERRIAANRRNAAKSGIHAESTTITGEDPRSPRSTYRNFLPDNQPATAIDGALLDNVIRDTWLLTRFFRIDAEIVDYEIDDSSHPKKLNQAGKAFMDISPTRAASSAASTTPAGGQSKPSRNSNPQPPRSLRYAGLGQIRHRVLRKRGGLHGLLRPAEVSGLLPQAEPVHDAPGMIRIVAHAELQLDPIGEA